MSVNNSYFIEFYRFGNSIKVTAIDPMTGLEACAIFPARNYPDYYMKQRAVAMLKRRIASESDDNNDNSVPGNGIIA